jgi:hypothetical protein
MTGIEKVGVIWNAIAAGSMTLAQVTIGNAGTLFGVGWALIGALLGMGVTYGMLRQRLTHVEQKTDNLSEVCATKESVEALEKQVNTLVRMLESRIADRRRDPA